VQRVTLAIRATPVQPVTLAIPATPVPLVQQATPVPRPAKGESKDAKD